MSEIVEKSIKCDRCHLIFRYTDGALLAGQPVRHKTAGEVRTFARARKWRCRAWTLSGKMIDAYPNCVPITKWERLVPEDDLRRRRRSVLPS